MVTHAHVPIEHPPHCVSCRSSQTRHASVGNGLALRGPARKGALWCQRCSWSTDTCNKPRISPPFLTSLGLFYLQLDYSIDGPCCGGKLWFSHRGGRRRVLGVSSGPPGTARAGHVILLLQMLSLHL